MKKSQLTRLLPRISVIAVSALVLCGLSVGAYAYMAPTSCVTMDVNPSIEYTLNQFDRVLSVQAINEDGEKILLEVKNINNKTIDEAIQLTLREISKAGYFDGTTPGGVVIVASGKEINAAENLADHLKDLVLAQCAKDQHTVSVASMGVNQQQLDEAKAMGVTAGKMLLVKELLEESQTLTPIIPEEWLHKSVREIMTEMERLDELNDANDVDDEINDPDEPEDMDDADDLADDADDLADDAADAAEDAAEIQEDAAEALKDAEEKALEEAAEAADEKRDAEDKARDLAEEAAEEKADAAEEAADAAQEDAARDADNHNELDSEPDDTENAA